MNKSFAKYIFIITLMLSFGCVRNVTVPIRNVQPILVVEGWITTDPPPYSVNLSYSGKFTSAYQRNLDSQQFIYDARVTIKDDLGDSTSCVQSVNGTYLSTDSNFIGKVGRTYTLKIYLSNGLIYQSKPEKITPVPPIDSIRVVYDSTFIAEVRPTQLIVSVDTHDPPDTANYYRWTASGYVIRKSWGEPCSPGNPPCYDPYSCVCSAFCNQLVTSDQINVFSDQFTDGHEILGRPVFYSPVYWHGYHYLEIKQYSISLQAYQFWQQYLNQTNRTGSILDPLPASLTGNIYNLADSNNLALGLFSASAVYSKKIVVEPNFLQTYWLEVSASFYIKQGSCHFVYPNTLENDVTPTGWENAEVIDMR
jgi:Domain of unknown function (DUF4249)